VGIVPVPVEDVVFPTGGHCGTRQHIGSLGSGINVQLGFMF